MYPDCTRKRANKRVQRNCGNSPLPLTPALAIRIGKGIIMKPKCWIPLFLSMLLTVLFEVAFAKDSPTYLIQASPKYCRHGLHVQPNGGSFSVFLFCDDAVGSNIGVILTEPGAGPGKIRLTGTKVWDKWDTNNRFWQEREKNGNPCVGDSGVSFPGLPNSERESHCQRGDGLYHHDEDL